MLRVYFLNPTQLVHMHLVVTGVILGEPFSVYSILMIAGLAASSLAYFYIIRRLSRGKARANGAAALASSLAFEVVFLALILGIFGIFLFIVIEIITAYFLKRNRKDSSRRDTGKGDQKAHF